MCDESELGSRSSVQMIEMFLYTSRGMLKMMSEAQVSHKCVFHFIPEMFTALLTSLLSPIHLCVGTLMQRVRNTLCLSFDLLRSSKWMDL